MTGKARAASAVARRIYAQVLRHHPAAAAGYADQMFATFDTLLERHTHRGNLAIGMLLIQEIAGLVMTGRATRTSLTPQPGSISMMETIRQDCRDAWRSFRRRPMFTAALVLTLGLGIGANTAIFSVVNAVLLQRLPFPNAERLAMVWEDASTFGFPRNTPAPGNYADWKASIRAFEDVAAIEQQDFNLAGDGEPEKIGGAGVTSNLFAVTGVQPLLGRAWRADEDTPGNRVAVLSYGLWQRRFGGDANVLNRVVRFNGNPYTVLGVMPPRFQLISPDMQIWVPINFTTAALANRGSHYLNVVARLRERATLDEANAELAQLAARSQQEHPETNRLVGMYAVALLDDYIGDTRTVLIVLMGAVGCVLLIACANVANLLLVAAMERSRDLSVRAALGANRGRLVRQLLTESLLLAGVGGAAGIGVAYWTFGTLTRLVPEPLADLSAVGLDARVLAATAAISMITGLLFGLAPAWRASRVDAAAAGGRSATRGLIGADTRLRHALVAGEIALATVLVIGAGLFFQSFRAINRVDLGFRPDHVLTARIQLPRLAYREFSARHQFVTSVIDRVRRIPSVTSVGYTSAAPLVWKGGTGGFLPEAVAIDPQLSYDAVNRVVSTGYMETIGMSLRAGRFFTEQDDERSQPVAVIGERMAKQYWPGLNPIGRRFRADPDGSGEAAVWRTIVGVVADTSVMGIDQPAKAEMYFPLAQSPRNWMWPRDLVIRVAGDPASIAAEVRRAVWAVDPIQPVSRVQTLDEIVGDELQSRQMQMTLMAAFAGLAVLLATVGVYGVLSYSVSMRTREIGLRLALGGDAHGVRTLVLRQGMTLAATGVAIGVTIAALGASLISALLYRVPARDPLTFATLPAILLLACLLASAVPAYRASRVEPMAALRGD